MANFATHIGVGTVVSGAFATITLAADVIAPDSLVAVTLAGVLGSVLPDIDLKDSRASRALFAGLATFFSFCVLFLNADKYSIAELWLIWLGAFVLVRYGGEAAFHRFSYHRGIWHSVLAGLFFWFLTAIVFKYVLGRHEGVAWLAGGFLFIGYMTHLILDEIFSVDLMGRRLKASFGSALKFFDSKHLGESLAIAVLTVVVFLLAPPSRTFVTGLSSPQLWSGLQKRLIPNDRRWFGVIGKDGIRFGRKPVLPTKASPITTGSLPANAKTPRVPEGAQR
ncbi:MAG: metal-dependent hydrolase [Hyphomicrobiaceae bacterium]|nr:metal-dependent hydrolase [Hyphomicrobiaceae bacterium]